MNYKATVSISGACNQYLYGTNLAKLEATAIVLLTKNKPGFGTIPRYYEVAESLGRVSGNLSSWKIIKRVEYKDIPEDKQVWREREAKKKAEREALEAVERANQCRCASPLTGQLCTLPKRHEGTHRIDESRHTVESFITQCPEGKCEYYAASLVMSIVRWQECVHCGHRKPLHLDQYILETPVGAVELFAQDDKEAIHFAGEYLAKSRVTQIPGIPAKMFASLKLFRYPKEYVGKPKEYQGNTGGLIEVAPFISFLAT